ncbi:MAG: hypothetical protein MHPSP_003229, partial [Paramarteilia canceri]
MTFPKHQINNWFNEVLNKAKWIEYYSVSGCYILRENCYSVWENIQAFVDKEFKKRGMKNVYFPMFVTEESMMKEKNQLEDFKHEMAFVMTH